MKNMSFKCPLCGCMLDVPEDAAGETAPCPNCNGEITVPTLPAPAKKRIVLSREDVNTLTHVRKAPRQSMVSIVLAFLVGIAIGISIGVFCPVRATLFQWADGLYKTAPASPAEKGGTAVTAETNAVAPTSSPATNTAPTETAAATHAAPPAAGTPSNAAPQDATAPTPAPAAPSPAAPAAAEPK